METNELDGKQSDEILRMRLVQISDELGALPDDSFAEKHELNVEADEVRAALREYEGDQSEKLNEWAERAGRKGIPLTDQEQLEQAVVQTRGSVGEGGAG